MSNTEKEQQYLQLSILGYIELATFVAIAFWLATDNNNAGIALGSQLIVMYLAGGITLIPSALAFILGPKKQDAKSIRKAVDTQKVLFITVCIAILPSFGMATWHPQFLLACGAGLFFYPIASGLVNSITRDSNPEPSRVAVSSPVNHEVSSSPAPMAGQFCAKCGSAFNDAGKCPSCA